MINAKTISQAQKIRSVTQKVALQINCKLGGELWALQIPMVRVFFGALQIQPASIIYSESIYPKIVSKSIHGKDNCLNLPGCIL